MKWNITGLDSVRLRVKEYQVMMLISASSTERRGSSSRTILHKSSFLKLDLRWNLTGIKFFWVPLYWVTLTLSFQDEWQFFGSFFWKRRHLVDIIVINAWPLAWQQRMRDETTSLTPIFVSQCGLKLLPTLWWAETFSQHHPLSVRSLSKTWQVWTECW